MNKVLLAILLIGINGCTHLSSHLINFENLPYINGEYGVGTQILEWIDSTRYENFTINENDYTRRLKQ